ncbi:MAG: DUF5337 family protein [Pseudomonadota bacterium]
MDQQEQAQRQSRLAAIVMAVTVVLWVGVSILGGQLGWPVRFAFLFDFAALAAFAWSLIVLLRVWRRSKG